MNMRKIDVGVLRAYVEYDQDTGIFTRRKDEAAHAYNKAAIKYFGEFAVLNPIGDPA